jgi:glycerol-3-phosphate dehydrogenase
MNRNLNTLSNNIYDVLVVGAGMYGCCVAWSASLRGLSVALVEKEDFCAATSANSLKMIHGGLRYLQNADIKRMRESIRERKILLRIAPHLVHPLPVIIPTYGHGMKGKEALGLGMALNDLISGDRNSGQEPNKYIPDGQVISPEECLELLPGIPTQGLTGGAVFCDAQTYNSERLPLAFLASAAKAGAELANYVEVVGFLKEDDRISGVQAKDVLTGNQFDIRAKTVVNTSGPWMNHLLGLMGDRSQPKIQLATAMNLVTRPLFENYAVGISSPKTYRDANAVIQKGSRFLFVAPWRGKSMIGTYYAPYDDRPDNFQVSEAQITEFIDEINRALPDAKLTLDDVEFVQSGLLPRTGIDAKSGEPQIAKHYQIYEQPGLLSVVGVKYTTARDVAEKVIDRVFKLSGQRSPKSLSSVTPIDGGDIEGFDSFLEKAISEQSGNLSEAIVRSLVYNYGSKYRNVLQYVDETAMTTNPEMAILKAEVLYGIKEEMAQTLSDVVFRRTELGTAGNPGEELLNICAETMATELDWSRNKLEQELQAVMTRFDRSPNLMAV